MKLIFNFIKKISKSLKDHLSIILFIPTFLGGTWQILELYRISPYHIRFFSFSQLASDGLLILIYLLIGYFALYIPYSKIIVNEDLDLEDTNDNKKETISKEGKAQLNILWYFFILGISFSIILKINTYSLSSYFQLLYILLIIVFSSILLLSHILFVWSKNKYIAIIISSFIIFGLSFSIREAYNKLKNSPDAKSYYYDKDFVKFYNTKNINRIVKEKIGDLPYTIQYFNDKYIFIIYENEKKEKNYLNLKFDAFFEFKKDELKPKIQKDSVYKELTTKTDSLNLKLDEIKKDSLNIQK
ncbi:hypothetical protein [Kordia zhangzhouensis]|uniref:hypothetical protein n=1 Tax=Kordia zhangzhouensis TaxID=1620405 RepID=UPI000629B1B4|nr:hypothetical protein [Kordia zhangzhouensis]